MIKAYLILGFLESGKTTYLNSLLPKISAEGKTVIICCEAGEEEYTCDSIPVIRITKEPDFSTENLLHFAGTEHPERVLIEWNGMWDPETAVSALHDAGWEIPRIDMIADASTFTLYFSNMGYRMLNMLHTAKAIFFNRMEPELEPILRGRRLRLYNKEAAVILNYGGGSVKSYEDLDVCPVNLDADTIEIKDELFALWYIDALDHPFRYDGKRVKMCLMMRRSPRFPGVDIPGRFAIVCCEKDMQFFGIAARGEALARFQNRNWIRITADIAVEKQALYQGLGPVLLVKEAVPCPEPTMEFVGF